MKISIPLFVFLASFYSGIMDSSAAANTPGSEFDRQVLAEIRELEQKQVQYPFDADLHFILGTNYWTLNDDEKAIEHYQRALLLEPDYHSVHWNLSAIYNHRGDGTSAITHMKKAEEIFLKKEDLSLIPVSFR